MFRLSIRKMLIGLTVLALASVAVFAVAAIFAVQSVNKNIQSIVETSELDLMTVNMGAAIGGFINRQSHILLANSESNLDLMSDRSTLEDSYQLVRGKINAYSNGASGLDNKLAQLNNSYSSFLAIDTQLYKFKLANLVLKKSLNDQAESVENISEQIQRKAEEISGKISFSANRIKRRVRKLVKNSAWIKDSKKQKVLQKNVSILVGGDATNGVILSNIIQLSAARLNAFAQKLVLLDNIDSITSLRDNHISQVIEKVSSALLALQQNLTSLPELVEISVRLKADVDLLSKKLLLDDTALLKLRVKLLESNKSLFAFNGTVQVAVTDIKSKLKGISQSAGNLRSAAVISSATVSEKSNKYIVGIGILACAVLLLCGAFIVKRVTKPIQYAVTAMSDIAHGDGDLTQRLELTGIVELDMLAKNFNNFIERIHALVSRTAESMNEISTAVSVSTENSKLTDQRAGKQQIQTDQIAAVVSQMGMNVADIAASTIRAAAAANETDTQVASGKAVVSDTVSSVSLLAGNISDTVSTLHELVTASNDIGQVLSVIRGVAEQTNLLALNAAIEAARAGEQGRGFAVVADEVRTLANRTQESTEEIREIIDRVQQGANRVELTMHEGSEQAKISVDQAQRALHALDEITNIVTDMKDMNTQIATAAEEQSANMGEIENSVQDIHTMANQTAADAQDTVSANDKLVSLNTTARKLVGQFKI